MPVICGVVRVAAGTAGRARKRETEGRPSSVADGQHPGRLRPERPRRTTLAEVCAAAGLDASTAVRPGAGDVAEHAAETVVTGVGLRAQDLDRGDLFAALPGSRIHGAEFAAEAIARGAVAVLTDPEGARIIDRSPD